LIDKGDYDLAIGLLEALEKEDPTTYLYGYELGYIYALRKDYVKALSVTDRILNRPDVNSQVYQMRGNCRSALGDKDMALAEYDKGLALFPDAGNLYLEKGNIFLQQKLYEEAAKWYRAGIQAEPMFASNYYRLSRLYLGSRDALTGIILGELCMNLDKNSKRSLELSRLVFQAYQQNIQFTPQGPQLSFCEIYLDAEKMQKEGYQLPLCAVFGNHMAKALQGIQVLDFSQFIQVRGRFIREYFNGGKGEPGNVLWEYLWLIHKAGHWEAYHWHLFQTVDSSGFEQWKLNHSGEYNAYLQWQGSTANQLQIDASNLFIF
jgi:tetratricopeptide (TPR) repeat protein